MISPGKHRRFPTSMLVDPGVFKKAKATWYFTVFRETVKPRLRDHSVTLPSGNGWQLLNMAIDSEVFPLNKIVIFHSFLYVYQRVPISIHLSTLITSPMAQLFHRGRPAFLPPRRVVQRRHKTPGRRLRERHARLPQRQRPCGSVVPHGDPQWCSLC